jgi:hypothetical protein
MFGNVDFIVVVHKDGLTIIKPDGDFIDVNKDNVDKRTIAMFSQQLAMVDKP